MNEQTNPIDPPLPPVMEAATNGPSAIDIPDRGQVIPIVCSISIDPATNSLNYVHRRLRCHADGRVFLLPFDPNPPAEDCPDGIAPVKPAAPAGSQRELSEEEVRKKLREYLRAGDKKAKAERHRKKKGMR